MDNNKSYRIHTSVGISNKLINVNLQQDMDFLEVLSIKLSQSNFYKLHSSNYGVIVGRVLANDAFGVPNVKISIFIPIDEKDKKNNEILSLYPYTSVDSVDSNNIRYNLLPNETKDVCHRDVGTFPSKRVMLDDKTELEIFDKYWKYTTVTNDAGDYCIYGVPVGDATVHCDLDISDCGLLSQKPRDMEAKGYSNTQFDSPVQFKSSTNLDNLSQIFSQDSTVYVYPFWGDSENGDAAITQNDIKLQYKFEPTCIFMGSLVTDSKNASIGHDCSATEKSGINRNLIGTKGKIEMIRKTVDNFVETYNIDGNDLIDDNGVWCYQIPMNLDYVGTDEYGNIVPIEDTNKGIPTRARVRFRVSLDDNDANSSNVHHGKILIPNNPPLEKTDWVITISSERDGNSLPSSDDYYEFGVSTPDNCFRDLFWNKVYSIKSYIPRIQTGRNDHENRHQDRYSGIRLTNYSDGKNPFPYNNIRVHLTFMYRVMCTLFHFIAGTVELINTFISVYDNTLAPIRVVIHGISKFLWILKFLVRPLKLLIDALIIPCIPLKISVPGSSCLDTTYYLGCSGEGWRRTKRSHGDGSMNDRRSDYETILDDMLSQEYELASLDFYNDWINGSMYLPLWMWKKQPKKTYFWGLWGRRGVNTYCSCDEQKKAVLFQQCVDKLNNDGEKADDTKSGNWHDSSQHTIFYRLTHGIVKPFENSNEDSSYYYAHGVYSSTSGEYYRLYATDIILLGGLNDCDPDGLPQLFNNLPSTTHNSIPFIKESYLTCETDNDKDDTSSVYIEARTGYNTKTIGSVLKSLAKYGDGYFFNISCNNLETYHKTGVNASRLSELGVMPDIQYYENRLTPNDITNVISYSDGLITRKEITDNDSRAAFATLNSISFDPYYEIIDKGTGYRKYDIEYTYPTDFDGSLQRSALAWTAGKQPMSPVSDKNNSYYVKYRYGQNKHILSKTYGTEHSFPIYNNSFYFYFGIKDGATAIDLLKSKYLAKCTSNVKKGFEIVTSVKDCSICSEKIKYNNTDYYVFDGEIDVTLKGISKPYKYTLQYNDRTDILVYDNLGNIINFSNITGNTDTFTISGLRNGEYILKVTDDNENTSEVGVSLSPILPVIEYNEEGLGVYVSSENGSEVNCNGIYDAGEVQIYNISINGVNYDNSGLTFTKVDNLIIDTNGVAYGVEYNVYSQNVHIANIIFSRNDKKSISDALCNFSFPKISSNVYNYLSVKLPITMNIELREVCNGQDSDDKGNVYNSTIANAVIKNASPFNMLINSMPYEFLSPQYYTTNEPNNINLLNKWINIDKVVNYSDNGNIDNSGINGSYPSEKWNSWLLNSNNIIIGAIDKAVFKFNALFDFCNGMYITETGNNSMSVTANGGKDPLIINTVGPMTDYYDLLDYSINEPLESYYISSSEGKMITTNDGANIIFKNYNVLKNGGYSKALADGISFGINPMIGKDTNGLLNNNYQGFYCSVFTNNAGYETVSSLTPNETYISLPDNTLSMINTKHLLSKRTNDLTFNYYRNACKAPTGYNSYFKGMFVDKRLSYSMLAITANDFYPLNTIRVSGSTYNGIAMAYDDTNTDDNFKYNILSSKYPSFVSSSTIVFGSDGTALSSLTPSITLPTDEMLLEEKNDTKAQYYFNPSNGNLYDTIANSPSSNGQYKKLFSISLNGDDFGDASLVSKEESGASVYNFDKILNSDGAQQNFNFNASPCSFDIKPSLYNTYSESVVNNQDGTSSVTNSVSGYVVAITSEGDNVSSSFKMKSNVLFYLSLKEAMAYSGTTNLYGNSYIGWFDIHGSYKMLRKGGFNKEVAFVPEVFAPLIKIKPYTGSFIESKTRIPTLFFPNSLSQELHDFWDKTPDVGSGGVKWSDAAFIPYHNINFDNYIMLKNAAEVNIGFDRIKDGYSRLPSKPTYPAIDYLLYAKRNCANEKLWVNKFHVNGEYYEYDVGDYVSWIKKNDGYLSSYNGFYANGYSVPFSSWVELVHGGSRFQSWGYFISPFIKNSSLSNEDTSYHVNQSLGHVNEAFSPNSICNFDDKEYPYLTHIEHDDDSNTDSASVVTSDDEMFSNSYFGFNHRYAFIPTDDGVFRYDAMSLNGVDILGREYISIVTDTILKDTPSDLVRETRVINTNNIYDVRPIYIGCPSYSGVSGNDYSTMSVIIDFDKNTSFTDIVDGNTVVNCNSGFYIPSDGVYGDVISKVYFTNTEIMPNGKVKFSADLDFILSISTDEDNIVNDFNFALFIEDKHGMKWCFKFIYYGGNGEINFANQKMPLAPLT